jgi:hypothetical protein
VRDHDRKDDKHDKRVEEAERRLAGQWKYWGEDDQVMGKARKGRKGGNGKAKSSKRCIYKWNEKPFPSRQGMYHISGGGRGHD